MESHGHHTENLQYEDSLAPPHRLMLHAHIQSAPVDGRRCLLIFLTLQRTILALFNQIEVRVFMRMTT